MLRKSQCFPKDKRKFVVNWLLRAGTRRSQRRALAKKWLKEGPYRNYRYNVEDCADGTRVYLLRPTWLNKGFDFQVNVEGFRSRTRKRRGSTIEMPSHKDVIHDIRKKLKARPGFRKDLFGAIAAVFDCVEPEEVLKQFPKLTRIAVGLQPDKLLKVLKWLFIEQDLTYWLQTGRNMLMSAIETKAFRIPAPLKSRN